MMELAITYPAEPPAWNDSDRNPFRCAYCAKWVADGDGKWVKRDDTPLPGQFMGVHRVECRRVRRWFR